MLKPWLKIAAATALTTGLLAGQVLAAEQAIQVKGSDTMVHLGSAWAEEFMKKNPDIQISVSGGGSATGISALLNGTADIANASRLLKPEEITTAQGKGFTPMEHIVGLDGIAVIVNPANEVKQLTMNQVKQIFSGEVGNWKSFGGADQKIVIITRDSSGTFAFFQEHVLGKCDYSAKARRLASNAAIVQSVSGDAAAVGYVGMGYLKDAMGIVKVVPISKNEKSEAIVPSEETVKKCTYPISRGLQMYTKGEPAGAIKEYMDFIKGPEGQKIVEEMGFVAK